MFSRSVEVFIKHKHQGNDHSNKKTSECCWDHDKTPLRKEAPVRSNGGIDNLISAPSLASSSLATSNCRARMSKIVSLYLTSRS